MKHRGVFFFNVIEGNGDLTIIMNNGKDQFEVDAYSSRVMNSGIGITDQNELYVQDELGNPIFTESDTYCKESVSKRLKTLIHSLKLRVSA